MFTLQHPWTRLVTFKQLWKDIPVEPRIGSVRPDQQHANLGKRERRQKHSASVTPARRIRSWSVCVPTFHPSRSLRLRCLSARYNSSYVSERQLQATHEVHLNGTQTTRARETYHHSWPPLRFLTIGSPSPSGHGSPGISQSFKLPEVHY